MTGATNRYAPRLIGLAGAFLIAIGAVTMFGIPGQASSHPLDDYPGFGRSPDAVLRDDTVAYYEAWEREQHVADCMASAGFEYEPDVLYPLESTLDVADELDAAAPSLDEQDIAHPADVNEAIQGDLGADDRDGYYQALVGETADAWDEAMDTGEVPHDDFGYGGCVGEAQDTVGSVWTARLGMEPEFEQLRDEIAASAQLESTREEYATCTAEAGVRAEGPDELEEALATAEEAVLNGDASSLDSGEVSDDIEAIDDAAQACNDVWAEGYQLAELSAAEALVERNAEVLTAQAEQYAGVLEDIAADDEFTAYLGERAALAETAAVPNDVDE